MIWKEGDGVAVRRFQALAKDVPRDVRFAALRDAIRERYLYDPSDSYRMSGRSKGKERWEETRRCIAEAVHRDGDFLDVGCANGLLLETLMEWVGERGIRIVPHGVDLVPELLEYAKKRLPDHAANFEEGNVFYWEPSRTYDFVRTNYEYVRPPDLPETLRRLYDRAVAPGGRFILCHYSGEGPLADLPALFADLGWPVIGHAGADKVALAWTDKGRRGRPT